MRLPFLCAVFFATSLASPFVVRQENGSSVIASTEPQTGLQANATGSPGRLGTPHDPEFVHTEGCRVLFEYYRRTEPRAPVPDLFRVATLASRILRNKAAERHVPLGQVIREPTFMRDFFSNTGYGRLKVNLNIELRQPSYQNLLDFLNLWTLWLDGWHGGFAYGTQFEIWNDEDVSVGSGTITISEVQGTAQSNVSNSTTFQAEEKISMKDAAEYCNTFMYGLYIKSMSIFFRSLLFTDLFLGFGSHGRQAARTFSAAESRIGAERIAVQGLMTRQKNFTS